MKLAISTLVCNDWSLEKTIEVCKAEHIDAIEIRMGIHSWSKESLPNECYIKMHEKLQTANVLVSDLATSVVIKEYSQQALFDIERCAQIACILKCKGLRIMLGNFRTKWSDKVPQLNYKSIIKWLKNAETIMKKYNTEIWIETHNEFSSGFQLSNLLKNAKVSRCYFVWDIMHPLEVGETPEDTIKYMGSHLVHVHIKDGKQWEDRDLASFCYTKIGQGNLPIKDIFKALNKNGYNGYYSLEWEGVWRKELESENTKNEKIVKEYVNFMRQLND